MILNHLVIYSFMIITRTPYRVSLFGGGTDHPVWFNQNHGAVLSLTIDKFSYINVRILPPFFQHNFRVAYSKVETTFLASDIKHPAVREAFLKYAPGLNLELHHHGDLPSRSGVGSSSAFSVGIIHSLLALNGEIVSSAELAGMAIEFEQEILKENVGFQDQIACALGGINYITFGPNNAWSAELLDLSNEYITDIESRMFLIYSGIERLSSDITQSLLKNLDSKSHLMLRNQQLAEEAKEIFKNEGDLSQIGPMLMENWKLKWSANPAAATPELQELYSEGIRAGASGGKVLGAGGGGFLLFWVNPEHKINFAKKMSTSTIIPIRVSRGGSMRVI